MTEPIVFNWKAQLGAQMVGRVKVEDQYFQ